MVVAVSEPLPRGAARQALLRSVLAAVAALMLVLLTDWVEAPAVRALLLVALLLVTLSAGSKRPALAAILIVPVLTLVSSHAAIHDSPIDFLQATLPAFVPVVAVSALGHWLYWTLRPGAGRVAA
jgi:hypothetical protein